MKFLRWAGSAVVLLAGGALANCSQMFDAPATGSDGLPPAVLLGAIKPAHANQLLDGASMAAQR